MTRNPAFRRNCYVFALGANIRWWCVLIVLKPWAGRFIDPTACERATNVQQIGAQWRYSGPAHTPPRAKTDSKHIQSVYLKSKSFVSHCSSWTLTLTCNLLNMQLEISAYPLRQTTPVLKRPRYNLYTSSADTRSCTHLQLKTIGFM
jgi:hypothetical protein